MQGFGENDRRCKFSVKRDQERHAPHVLTVERHVKRHLSRCGTCLTAFGFARKHESRRCRLIRRAVIHRNWRDTRQDSIFGDSRLTMDITWSVCAAKPGN